MTASPSTWRNTISGATVMEWRSESSMYGERWSMLRPARFRSTITSVSDAFSIPVTRHTATTPRIARSPDYRSLRVVVKPSGLNTGALFTLERRDGIDPQGAPQGSRGRQGRDKREQNSGGEVTTGVEGAEAEQFPAEYPRPTGGNQKSAGQAPRDRRAELLEHAIDHVPRPGAERHADADFACALRDGEDYESPETHCRQRQREGAQRPDDRRHLVRHAELDVKGLSQDAGRNGDMRIDCPRRADQDAGHRCGIAVDAHDHHGPHHVLVVYRVVELRGFGTAQGRRWGVPDHTHNRRLLPGFAARVLARPHGMGKRLADHRGAGFVRLEVPAATERNPHHAEVGRID